MRVKFTKTITGSCAVIAAVFAFSHTADAQTKANRLFGAKSTASSQAPSAVGKYAKGCLAGAVQLPESGPTWQAVRLSRNRHWGHPEMISFIKRLSTQVASIPGWKGLYIGDISQPRGGPMTGSHQSHQLGLDADIWLLPPKRLNLNRAEREALSSKTVRSRSQRTVNGNWTSAHMAVIKAAASDPAVDRIFITAPAKVWMCKNARGNRKWLQKVRPYWGHHYHFHVRLNCPKGSSECQKQRPTVRQLSKNATGCDKDLNWWVTTALDPPDPNAPKPPKKPRKRGARDYFMSDLPKQCKNVLTSK